MPDIKQTWIAPLVTGTLAAVLGGLALYFLIGEPGDTRRTRGDEQQAERKAYGPRKPDASRWKKLDDPE